MSAKQNMDNENAEVRFDLLEEDVEPRKPGRPKDSALTQYGKDIMTEAAARKKNMAGQACAKELSHLLHELLKRYSKTPIWIPCDTRSMFVTSLMPKDIFKRCYMPLSLYLFSDVKIDKNNSLLSVQLIFERPIYNYAGGGKPAPYSIHITDLIAGLLSTDIMTQIHFCDPALQRTFLVNAREIIKKHPDDIDSNKIINDNYNWLYNNTIQCSDRYNYVMPNREFENAKLNLINNKITILKDMVYRDVTKLKNSGLTKYQEYDVQRVDSLTAQKDKYYQKLMALYKKARNAEIEEIKLKWPDPRDNALYLNDLQITDAIVYKHLTAKEYDYYIDGASRLNNICNTLNLLKTWLKHKDSLEKAVKEQAALIGKDSVVTDSIYKNMPADGFELMDKFWRQYEEEEKNNQRSNVISNDVNKAIAVKTAAELLAGKFKIKKESKKGKLGPVTSILTNPNTVTIKKRQKDSNEQADEPLTEH